MHLPASHFSLQQPTLFVNHTLRSFEILQQPNIYTKHIYREELNKSDKQYSLFSDGRSPTVDSSFTSCTSANSKFTPLTRLFDETISSMSRLFDSVFRPSVSSHPGQRNPVQCYNLDIYAPTAQFPGVQSSRLPATNPSFQMARFLKSTGPGPSKLQDNSPNKNKRDRNRYKLMVQLARKAARNIRSEGG